MTTKQDIEEWLKEGKKKKYTYLIIVCDTFSYEDYPIFVSKKENIDEVRRKYSGNMQRVQHIYNIKTGKLI